MRLIDADALCKKVKATYCQGCYDYYGVRCRACNIMDFVDLVEDFETLDAEPVKHGHNESTCEGGFKCSVCKWHNRDKLYFDSFKICPNCGAKMEEE